MRHHLRRREGPVWTARDCPGHHPRSWGDTEAYQGHWQIKSHGNDSYRSLSLSLSLSLSILLHFVGVGERISAQEAEKHGLVSKIVPVDELVDEAVKLGEKISGMSKVAVAMAKMAINASNNLSLDEGTIYILCC